MEFDDDIMLAIFRQFEKSHPHNLVSSQRQDDWTLDEIKRWCPAEFGKLPSYSAEGSRIMLHLAIFANDFLLRRAITSSLVASRVRFETATDYLSYAGRQFFNSKIHVDKKE